MLIFSAFLIYRQSPEFFKEMKTRRKYFLIVEALTLAFFVAFLLVRFGNPDLWHPWKGGEKPMDFSYFNAILKSTVFPPYDPWYAGGYLNYYYFGFVIAGVLVKWLGIVPSIAYNLLIPTFFSLIAMGGFSIAWNLFQSSRKQHQSDNREKNLIAYISAIAGAIGIAVLGNLGSVRMIFQGYQRLASPDGVIEGAPILTRWLWAIQGFWEVFTGGNLPYSLGDWYWIPSRAIPAPGDIEPITEFPFFTVLYGDLHAHLMALPVTLLALSLFIGLVLGKARWAGRLPGITWLLVAALATGALRPTNTWDFPPYLALGLVAIIYTFWKYFDPKQAQEPHPDAEAQQNAVQALLNRLPNSARRMLRVLTVSALFILLSFFLFQPFADWYALGYTKINVWEGSHTPVTSYLTHWGLFLFLIVAWMARESLEWMAETPVSALRSLRPHIFWIQFALVVLIASILILLWMEVRIAWLVLPLAAWAGVLLLKPSHSDAKRIVLFIVGTGLVLTLMVEVIVLVGDIGRMNTVFKFYLQVWTLFAVSAAAALAWTLKSLGRMSPLWRRAWQIILAVLVTGASFYPLLAGTAKIKDRMAENAPHSLDGMEYMQFAEYADNWGVMDINQDYQAIRWLQENVVGSPVIVEANLRNLYRWGSRMSIYTGLPGVVGWEWHQQQQRTVTPGAWVTNRILEIDDFYLTTDWEAAQKFLRKYDVQYIIVGQQERGHYPGAGLEKFISAEGTIWKEVFRYQDTVIYQVLDR
jgi:YYY domain-containing protein